MPIECDAYFSNSSDLSRLTPNSVAGALEDSMIRHMAAEVRDLRAQGTPVMNFTIGDFAPSQFPIPPGLRRRIKKHLDAGQTNYPSADGLPQLRQAIRRLYKNSLGLDYPEGCVQVGSGARPPIYATFATVLDPGDMVVYPVPSWNIHYYVYLQQAKNVPVVTKPENGFMPRAHDLLPHLPKARLVILTSPLNPAGTTISKELLRDICEAMVEENRRRRRDGERPVMLLYDQVYWQLTYGQNRHYTPIELLPEMARYTILIDAISKNWAATGLRVGWAVVPPWLRSRMKPFVGHMGAFAGRAEQLATAELLNETDELKPFMNQFRHGLQLRLNRLHKGLQAMKADGLPVDSMAPQGAIYLSARFDGLIGSVLPDGTTLDSDDDMRRHLLHKANVAIVPFNAFGYPANTGWVRFAVGAVSLQDIDTALERLRALLQ
ncbi:MAG: aminotransferase class I/II-fold pyridoxal phosphate-dependent enzyme [Proteobacteria bacterium]|nr:aminotransferase class I/II-fold pyridoxal phosphate-dependent enzyme [Pseudomonadota bacterium]